MAKVPHAERPAAISTSKLIIATVFAPPGGAETTAKIATNGEATNKPRDSTQLGPVKPDRLEEADAGQVSLPER